MTTNPALQQLGFSANDRVFVFHADDIGLNYASVAAYENLLTDSPLSSAATMVPCAWFPYAATVCNNYLSHPNHDMGVHLTLTSEWNHCRWRPLSTIDPASGLLDTDRYFPQQVEPVQRDAAIGVVEQELRAQVERAISAEIDITHIDTHMGTLMHPRFFPTYMELALEYNVPAFGVRWTVPYLMQRGLDQAVAEQIVAYLADVAARGMPQFDGSFMLPLDQGFTLSDRLEIAKQMLNSAEAGLYYFLLHPCIETPALRKLAPDWKARVGDYNLFMSDEWRREIEASGIKIVGMKTLRDAMRKERTTNK